jgi:hypothetical protein
MANQKKIKIDQDRNNLDHNKEISIIAGFDRDRNFLILIRMIFINDYNLNS